MSDGHHTAVAHQGAAACQERGDEMNTRGLILRALIALLMLSAVGLSQAARPKQAGGWQAASGGFVSLEVQGGTFYQLERDLPFFKRLMVKAPWAKVVTRAGSSGCVGGTLSAVTSDSFNQQRTWWLKGLRVITGCAAGAVAAATTDFFAATLLIAGAPELAAFGGSIAIAAAVGFGVDYLVERLWAAHTIGTGAADTTSSPDYNGIPRGLLEVHDDEYHGTAWGSQNHHLLWQHRHPQSGWAAGEEISTSTATRVGHDEVGYHWLPKYKPVKAVH